MKVLVVMRIRHGWLVSAGCMGAAEGYSSSYLNTMHGASSGTRMLQQRRCGDKAWGGLGPWCAALTGGRNRIRLAPAVTTAGILMKCGTPDQQFFYIVDSTCRPTH